MKQLPIMISCVAALVLSACAGDDHSHRKPPEVPWHPATQMLQKYVTNADGSLARAQMQAGLRKDFDAADRSKTGCLDTDEVRAINEERIAEDQSTASPLVDFTGKGCIDFETFSNTPRSLFQALDRDNNGVLTSQELHPWIPPKDDKDAPDQNGEGRYGRPPPNGSDGPPPGGGSGTN